MLRTGSKRIFPDQRYATRTWLRARQWLAKHGFFFFSFFLFYLQDLKDFHHRRVSDEPLLRADECLLPKSQRHLRLFGVIRLSLHFYGPLTPADCLR